MTHPQAAAPLRTILPLCTIPPQGAGKDSAMISIRSRQFRYKIQHREGLILYYFRNQNSFY
jgi:hypothetical protein